MRIVVFGFKAIPTMIESVIHTPVLSNNGLANQVRFTEQASKKSGSASVASSSDSAVELTHEEQQQVQQLKQTDRSVRAHEQAHLSVGADLVRGGPSYTYQLGPDNRRYAISGEVSIDTSPGRTPEETIPKARHIRATALAPAEPSAQDQSVAAKAVRMENSARIELAVQQRETAKNEISNSDQGAFRIYRKSAQNNEESAQVGARVDIFA